jgi:hypothetical protein
MRRAEMIEGNANPFSAAPPLCRCSIGLAPILETTKGNITNGQIFIILSGVLIVAIANTGEALRMEIAATANDAALRTLNLSGPG